MRIGKTLSAGIAALALGGVLPVAAAAAAAATVTIATVNNPDMEIMKKLTPEFEKARPNIHIAWDVMPENELRRKVTVDIATQSGSYDVVTLGTLSVPIWAKNGWIRPFENLPSSYDESDLLKPVREALSYKNHLYALPFYAESSITYYRKDLFSKAGLKMPEHPTWDQVASFAKKLTDRKNDVNGICLRGLPGWGENMAFFDTLVNTFGGRWFNKQWQPQLTSQPWKNALDFYIKLIRHYGPSGTTSDGFVEDENLFANGHCAMWVDATVAAGYLANPKESKVADQVGFAWAPVEKTKNGSHWLWAWSLAIPKDTQNYKAARTFVTWATSKEYVKLVAKRDGWVSAPPGTRESTYKNDNYVKAAPFAPLVEKAISAADSHHPTAKPVPYTGIQYVAIPEFQAIGHAVGQNVAAALSGQMSADDALQKSQKYVQGVMKEAGYPKK